MLPGGDPSNRNPKPVIKHIFETKEISLFASPSSSNPVEHQKPKTHQRDPPCASAIFINSNEDILRQILIRLPPKSLLRFQCVSKQWLSIISEAAFRRNHRRRYPCNANSLFLFQKIENKGVLNFLSFREEDVNSMTSLTSRMSNLLDGEIEHFHSCNGLLCIDFNLANEGNELVVYNPTTSQYKLIPWPESATPYVCRAANIAFDPSKSDHYKLVCVWWDCWVEQFRFLVYSSETEVWRYLEETEFMGPEGLCFRRGVLWNGDLHWFSGYMCTLCFDLENDRFRTKMPRVRTRMYENEVWYFGESSGHLYFIGLQDPKSFMFDVFELERDYSQWTLKHRVDFTPLTTLYPSMLSTNYGPFNGRQLFSNFYIAYLLVDEKENKLRLVISVVGKIISYDVNHLTAKELAEVEPVDIVICGKNISAYGWFDAFQHSETLACV